MLPRLIYALIACLWTASALANNVLLSDNTVAAATTKSSVQDSQKMEMDLQNLPWKQFRSIIESIPKLKADVEAHGTIGWKYVQTNYTTYGWKKNIDKLDDTQKRGLADLIQVAKGAR